MGKKALITGITGQDGSYLAELLLSKGYEVHGLVRRMAFEDPHHSLCRIEPIKDKLHLHAGSLESFASLYRMVGRIRPDECYHLAAQSFVSYSFDDEFSTLDSNIRGTNYVLSALRELAPDCKVYFASSSEMFGNADVSPQNEETKFNPRSPYGISKVAGFHIVKNYRDAYNMFAVSGILFNHESPRRGLEFVTRKISRAVAEIKLGKRNELKLGTLTAQRDWGYAGEYVHAMWQILQQDKPDDFVISTGQSHSVQEFIEKAFSVVDLDWQKYVQTDSTFVRPAETRLLCGDSAKARSALNWQPKVQFERLVEMMVLSDMELLQGSAPLSYADEVKKWVGSLTI